MRIELKRMFIFFIILSIFAISAVNASDINSDNGIADAAIADNGYCMIINEKIDQINDNGEDLDLENSERENIDLENSEIKVSEELKNLGTENDNEHNDEGTDDSNPENNEEETDDSSSNNDEETDDSNSDNNEDNSSDDQSVIKNKTKPRISIKTSYLKSRDVLTIFLKDSENQPLKYKKLNILIDKKNRVVKTNSKGIARLKLFLKPKRYKISIQFDEDDDYKSVSKKYTLKVSKLGTKIKTYANYVVRKKRLYIYLLGKDWKGVSKRKVILKFRKKTYVKKTNKNGRVSLKIRLPVGRYKIKAKFKGDKYFYKSSKKFKFYVTKTISFKLANTKILKNGYLRIYLKGKNKKAISHKKMIIKIGKKRFKKRTNGEGIIVFKPNLSLKNHTVIVKYGKYSVNKRLACINDTIKNPLKHNISLVHGAPDTDYMPKSYVMGDGSATYTLKRSQYMEVMKRDSYCLYLNNRLSKYVFFKTMSHPKTNHIIKREKWNVIEREINKKLVRKNRYNYWPGKVKVSLKGKSYKYSEVRDPQNTPYTCGPTSASVCTQVLRNYFSEKYLAKHAGTNREGTKMYKLVKALNKNNFTCIYFYRDSFKIGLNELKKGGCAVVFHAQDHYVSILDISKNGKKVLVSNSYGSYDGIPTRWVSTSYMNRKFGHFDDSIVIRLNYTLSNSKKNSVNCFYNSMGPKWYRHGPRSRIGRI